MLFPLFLSIPCSSGLLFHLYARSSSSTLSMTDLATSAARLAAARDGWPGRDCWCIEMAVAVPSYRLRISLCQSEGAAVILVYTSSILGLN